MMARIKAILLWVWTILTTPAATLSLAFLTLGGFVGGVMFWELEHDDAQSSLLNALHEGLKP